MSLVDVQRIQKAIKRCGAQDFEAIRRRAENKVPVDLASERALAERRQFLLQTTESAAAADAAFERIIQGNELQDVNYLPRGSRAARSIGRIWIREPNGTVIGYGTGFLIGHRVLLTNNHVLKSTQWAERSEVEFEYEKSEEGKQLNGVKFALEPENLFLTNEPLDFSVVAVAPRALNAERELGEFGFLPLIGGTGKATEGEWLTIIQHPRGELKQVSVRENRLLRKSDDVLWYSTDTLGGSSGAPVFNNDWLVVALHHSGVPEIKNERWQTIDGKDYDERIHREEDIKWVANEGIRVSRIVETLRRELGTHPLIQPFINVTPSEISMQSTPTLLIPIMNAASTPVTSLAGRKFVISFDAAGRPDISAVPSAAMAESIHLAIEAAKPKAKPKAAPKGVSCKFNNDYSNRKGFDDNFLGKAGDKGKHRVHLPQLTSALAESAVKLLEPPGTKNYVLDYTNMSLVMHAKRRFAIYSAANVDFAHRYLNLKSKRVWRYDPRIPLDAQVGDEAYAGNRFDKGHITRQEDMEYGDTIPEALQSTADTCHWTNCTLQHDKFNRTQEWWQGMEQHILEHSIDPHAKGFRAQIFSGPVFTKQDPEYDEVPDIKVPMKFWKVCAAVTSSGNLFAVAYLLDQSTVIKQFGLAEAAGEVPFEPYKLFQLPITELEDMIHLKFTFGPSKDPLSDCDPLKDGPPPELDSDQDGDDDRLESTGDGSRTPTGWVNMLRHRPYFG
jgi:endonuclease G